MTLTIFLYGALGGLLPELLRARWVHQRVTAGELPSRPAVVSAVLISGAWILAAGAFATALPGSVAKLTAVYAGMSLPLTVTRIAAGKSLTIDSIVLSTRPQFHQVFVLVFRSVWPPT